MLHRDTRGKGREAFSPVWMWMIAVLAATWTVQGTTVSLYPSSTACNTVNSTLHCHGNAENKVYKLDDFKWNDIEKVIIRNVKELVLEEPACSDTTKKQEVEVHNSEKVTTEPGSTNCSLQLVLHNSKNVKITDGVDLVRMVASVADEINLPRVSQFDLEEESLVRKVSVRVDGKMSTIERSGIQVVKKMEIQGSFLFKAEDSILEKVEGFLYDSSEKATFSNVTLGSVAAGGFLVLRGEVTIKDSRIGSVESHGLLVMGSSKLVIINTVLHSIAYNSIVVNGSGTVSFKNVTVADKGEISFTLSDATRNLLPLALLGKFHVSAPLGWVVLYVCVGMAVGCLSAVAVMYFGFRRRSKFNTEVDAAELITREQPSPPSESAPSPLPNNNNIKNAPIPPIRPLPDVPKSSPITLSQDDELYEPSYMDVAPNLPPGVVAQRPPMPVPDESSFTGGSTLPISDQQFAAPITRPNHPNKKDPKGSERKDDRDDLPPPPSLPDEREELYDELENLSASNNPLPPPQALKPKLPPLKKRLPPPAPVRKY